MLSRTVYVHDVRLERWHTRNCHLSCYRSFYLFKWFWVRSNLSNLKKLSQDRKKFKPGDWVKTKGNLEAPKMEVIKYITKKDPLVGTIKSNTYLECVYCQNGERFVKTVHQDILLKLREVSGLYKS